MRGRILRIGQAACTLPAEAVPTPDGHDLEGAMGRSLAVFALPAIALVVGLSVQTRALASVTHEPQTAPAPREDVLAALLIEVRGLRVAMEQMAAAGPRVQLAL